MLLHLDTGMQAFRRISGQYGHAGLPEDGARVHASVHIMHGAAAFFRARMDGLFPGVQAGKRGQERGMDVCLLYTSDAADE